MSKHHLPHLVPPKVRRRVGRTLLIILTILLILAVGSFFLGIKVKFLIGEELQVKITQENHLYTIDSDQNADVSFTIETDNFLSCHSSCSYQLVDLMSNDVVSEEGFYLEHGTSYQKTVSLPPKSANKLYLYDLKVGCHNIKSLICLTEEEEKYNSALFLVQTEFTGEENSLNQKTKERLQETINKYKWVKEKLNSLKNILSAFYVFGQEEEQIATELDLREEELVKIEKSLQQQIAYWQDSELKKISKIEFDQTLTALTQLETQLQTIQILRKDTIERFNNLSQQKEQLAIASGNSPLFKEELGKIELNHLKMTKLGGFSEAELNQEVQLSQTILLRLLDDYNQQKESVFNDYSSLISKRYPHQNCSTFREINEELLATNSSADLTRLTDFIDKNCLSNQSETITADLTTLPLLVENKTTKTTITIGEQKTKCCAFEKCLAPEEGKPKPILFIHGHAFNEKNNPEASLTAFANLQQELEKEGLINVGEVTFDHFYPELNNCPFQMTMRSTYYYIPHLSLGKYQIVAQKSERIENYALRLKEMIDFIKDSSGSDKVTIVAHSMGGLVVRQYMALFGSADLNKVIFVNVPHHGVSGKVEEYCSIVGAAKECEDLSQGSIFLQRINSNPLPLGTEFYNIRSKGCLMDNNEDGDGIVTFSSAYLEGAEDITIEGECTDSLQSDLHSGVLNTEKYPEISKLILTAVEEEK